MNIKKMKRFSFDMGPIRPPSEGRDSSLLIRATINCPWNKCMFCNAYGNNRFVYRKVEDIKQDIDTARCLHDELKSVSREIGHGGAIDNETLNALIRGNSEIYERQSVRPNILNSRLQCLVNVAGWMASGAKTAFLQDANSLLMRTSELAEVLTYLKKVFPSIERITSYARSITAAKKSDEELRQLYEAGLSRLHIGLESGCDEVLQYMKKGVTAAGHIKGGRKIVASGISLSEYVMPGLGGKKYSKKHAVETADVLNQINPDFIRLRSLIARKGIELLDKIESGEFKLLTEDEVIDEIELFIQNLDCDSYLASDQMANLLWEIEGQLPNDKEAMLRVIKSYKSRSRLERLKFILERRLKSYVSVYGGLNNEMEEIINAAFGSLEQKSSDAAAKVEAGLAALKSGFV